MRSLIFLVVASFCASADAADTWPQWRGPNRDCRVEGQTWPDTLSGENLKLEYEVSLGESYSGPIVTDDHVFVTESVDGNESVVALKRDTGEQVWKQSWTAGMKVPFFAAANGSWIRSTPAYADGRLFVASMEDMFVCLDAKTGDVLWTKDVRKEYGTANQSFGFACSPIVDGDAVYVHTNAGMLKCDVATGKTIWQALSENTGMMSGGAFSSPVIAEIEGVRQLVVQTRSELTGLTLDEGKSLWSQPVPAFRGMNILTPTLVGNQIFTSSYRNGSFMFEVNSTPDGLAVAELWKNNKPAYMSSPVEHDGHIYAHLQSKRFACMSIADGSTKWNSSESFGGYVSMAVNGDQCLALDEKGILFLLKLNPAEYTKVGSSKVSQTSAWAHVAVCDNQVFVRSLDKLLVYRWQ